MMVHLASLGISQEGGRIGGRSLIIMGQGPHVSDKGLELHSGTCPRNGKEGARSGGSKNGWARREGVKNKRH